MNNTQKLILPIADMRLTAAYKNEAYRAYFGFSHYGVDCTSKSGNTALYALGNGRVIAAGLDGTKGEKSGLGYVAVVVYPNCEVRGRDVPCDLVCTYFHMREMPAVKAGDTVSAATLLGHYGNTGGNTTGAHLHIQFDTDTGYPLHCAGIGAANSQILKAGTVDSTVDPLDVLYLGEGQSLMSDVDPKYYAGESLALPHVQQTVQASWEERYNSLIERLRALLREEES